MTIAAQQDVTPSTSVRPGAILVLVVLATALSNLEVGLVNVALPSIAETFGVVPATVQWVAIAYQLAIVGTLILFGRLVDMYGGRSLYLAGMATIAAASLLAAVSANIVWLIIGRGLLGLGAAMLLATGQTLLMVAYPGDDRGRALGFMHVAVAGGLMAGPSVGGLLVSAVDWRAALLAPLPLAGVAFWWAWKTLPAARRVHREPLDVTGATLIFTMAVIAVFTLTRLAQAGWTDWIGGLVGLTLLTGALFVVAERRQTAPLVDPQLLRRPALLIGLMATFLTFIALASNMFLVPFALQDLMGHSAAEAGLLMMAVPVAILPVAPVAGALADRIGSQLPASVGLVVIAGAIIGMATFTTATPVWLTIVILALYGVGAGLFQAPNNRAVLDNAPDGREGIVSGMLALSRNLGQVAGVAIASGIWTWRNAMDEETSNGDVLGAGLRDAFLVLAGVGVVALLVSTVRFRLKGHSHVTD